MLLLPGLCSVPCACIKQGVPYCLWHELLLQFVRHKHACRQAGSFHGNQLNTPDAATAAAARCLAVMKPQPWTVMKSEGTTLAGLHQSFSLLPVVTAAGESFCLFPVVTAAGCLAGLSMNVSYASAGNRCSVVAFALQKGKRDHLTKAIAFLYRIAEPLPHF
jgi:hypothetical protein